MVGVWGGRKGHKICKWGRKNFRCWHWRERGLLLPTYCLNPYSLTTRLPSCPRRQDKNLHSSLSVTDRMQSFSKCRWHLRKGLHSGVHCASLLCPLSATLWSAKCIFGQVLSLAPPSGQAQRKSTFVVGSGVPTSSSSLSWTGPKAIPMLTSNQATEQTNSCSLGCSVVLQRQARLPWLWTISPFPRQFCQVHGRSPTGLLFEVAAVTQRLVLMREKSIICPGRQSAAGCRVYV